MRAFPRWLAIPFLLISAGAVTVEAATPILPSTQSRREIAPRLDQALNAYEIGYQLYRRGDFSAAEQQWKTAIELEPNLIKAHYWLGKLYREMGRLNESTYHWEEVLRLQNLIHDRRLALGTQNNDYPALDQIKMTRDREKKASEAFARGKQFLSEGHWDAAVAEFKSAVTLFSANPEYLRMLARVLADRGEPEGSRKAYRQVLELPNPGREVTLEAIDALLEGNDRDPAEAALRAMLRQSPGDADAAARLQSLDKSSPPEVAFAGKILSRHDQQVVLDIGLDRGLKLADEYSLGLRAFRPGEPVKDPVTERVLGRQFDTITGELLITKVFAKSCWALIRKEFATGVKTGDLIEIADRRGR